MTRIPMSLSDRRWCWGTVWLFLVLLGGSSPRAFAGAPSAGAAPRPPGTVRNEPAKAPAALSPPSSSLHLPLFAEGWWDKIYTPVESFLRNRSRMIQFGAVGM